MGPGAVSRHAGGEARMKDPQKPAQEIGDLLTVDAVCRPCRCAKCIHGRLLRMLRDLDHKYDAETVIELDTAKDTIQ